MEKKMEQKQTAAEDLARMVQWFKRIDVGELVRRGFAVGLALMGGAFAVTVWVLAAMMFVELGNTGDWGWIVGGMGTSGFALFVTFGAMYVVYDLWED